MSRQIVVSCLILTVCVRAITSRAVNITTTWVLPEEGFPVFYRYFKDRITWYEADAVCQFHHANLITIDTTAQFDASRAYLKELDIVNNVWIGLTKTEKTGEFTWTDRSEFKKLSHDGFWADAITKDVAPLCTVLDPTSEFRWHVQQCGGPQVASFICELPVPSWARDLNGCMLTSLPSLTIIYLPEQGAVELTSDCGLQGTKSIVCKGNSDRDEMIRQLSCGLLPEDFDEQKIISNMAETRRTTEGVPSDSLGNSIPLDVAGFWTTQYGASTRHRRETTRPDIPVTEVNVRTTGMDGATVASVMVSSERVELLGASTEAISVGKVFDDMPGSVIVGEDNSDQVEVFDGLNDSKKEELLDGGLTGPTGELVVDATSSTMDVELNETIINEHIKKALEVEAGLVTTEDSREAISVGMMGRYNYTLVKKEEEKQLMKVVETLKDLGRREEEKWAVVRESIKGVVENMEKALDGQMVRDVEKNEEMINKRQNGDAVAIHERENDEINVNINEKMNEKEMDDKMKGKIEKTPKKEIENIPKKQIDNTWKKEIKTSKKEEEIKMAEKETKQTKEMKETQAPMKNSLRPDVNIDIIIKNKDTNKHIDYSIILDGSIAKDIPPILTTFKNNRVMNITKNIEVNRIDQVDGKKKDLSIGMVTLNVSTTTMENMLMSEEPRVPNRHRTLTQPPNNSFMSRVFG